MVAAAVEIALVALQLEDRRLVMQRRDGGAPISPWLLGFFGGHIEPGEDAEFAVARELEEETSLLAEPTRLAPITSFVIEPSSRPDGQPIAVHVFAGSMRAAELPTLQVFEGSGFEVYGYDELVVRNDVAPTAMSVLLDPAVRTVIC